MSVSAWERVLSDMEEELDVLEEALRSGASSLVPAFEEPEGIGPLPPQLADRAAHLVERIRLLETFVKYQLIATKGDLQFAGQTPSGNRTLALYLDASA